MDTFVSGMQTSITSKSGLTGTTRGTDSSRLNKDRELLEFGKLSSQNGYCCSEVFHGHNCL